MECKACKIAHKTEEYMKCRICLGKYHCDCLGIKVKHFLKYTEEQKTTWTCPMCLNVTQRVRTKDNTPVRSRNMQALEDDSLNMSCDSFEPSAVITIPGPSVSSAVSSGPTVSNTEVTMENISALLDAKLNTSRMEFMDSFRKVLKAEVRAMVKHELESTLKNLKDEFTATTDFMCDEQRSLKSDININADKIKNLDCNIEIQAVPEQKNENVLGLLKKLCDVIKLPLDDGKISACRRVAKHNATSSRPRNIVVTFASPRIRDMVLSASHRYLKAHPGRGLTSIDLEIPGETRKIFSLHAASRQTAKERGYKYVWIKYGQIYMRKDESAGAVLIKDMDSLNKLS
ncbi:hypothetical protein ABMA28_001119 [Loxostege sticticalis]|uniref:PHD-type domain-containing protein n=1 Tax=Loxostege sticticalis TaxID=481309 RepID=A0ABD0T4Q2_LOXSC